MIFLAVLGVFGLAVAGSIWSGYVFSVMWGWFVVPYFHLPAISIPVAIGVGLIVSMLTHDKTGNEAEEVKTSSEKIAMAIVMSLVLPAIFLFAGWVTTKFL